MINEAMDIKLKIQQAQQRDLFHDDEENSVSAKAITFSVVAL